jgi:hypothetical protein
VGAGLPGVCCAAAGGWAAKTPAIIPASNIGGGRKKTEFMTIFPSQPYRSREIRRSACRNERDINTTRY